MAFTNLQIAEYISNKMRKEENMRPFDKLTEEDKLQILNFIRYNVGEPKVSAEDILNYWNDAKQELFDAFGHQLIVEKKVQYIRPERMLISACEDLLSSHRLFFNKLSDTMYNQLQENVNWWTISSLMGTSHSWADNKLSLNSNQNAVKIEYNGKSVKFQEGSRQTKAIIKLVEMFCPDLMAEAEEIRLEHSRILNQKKLTGTLCLSIHPLDYMTMSVNDEGWSSCMSWDPSDDGCYKQGTVEMMNSNCVAVAYLKSDRHQLEGCGYKWNSKKWRTLLIFSDKLITTVKGYPYQSVEMAQASLEFANEIFNYRFGEKSQALPFYNYAELADEGRLFGLRFSTHCMYNDFGYTSSAFILFNPNLYHVDDETQALEGPDVSINYSGVTECVICGEDISSNYIDEKLLECADCAGIIGYCADCGEPIFSGNYYEVIDGEYYCEACIEDNFYWSDITNSYINSYNSVSVHIMAMTEQGEIIDEAIDGGYISDDSLSRLSGHYNDSIYQLKDCTIVGDDVVYGYYDDGAFYVLADQPLVPYMENNESYICKWRDMRVTTVPMCKWGWLQNDRIHHSENIYNELLDFTFQLENDEE